MADLILYRGINSYQGAGPKFYHKDPQFARQFTQSGLPEEILKVSIPEEAIYRADPLPYGGDPDETDAVIETARSGGYAAIYTDEGTAGEPSVLVFKKGHPLRVLGRCTSADLGESLLSIALGGT